MMESSMTLKMSPHLSESEPDDVGFTPPSLSLSLLPSGKKNNCSQEDEQCHPDGRRRRRRSFFAIQEKPILGKSSKKACRKQAEEEEEPASGGNHMGLMDFFSSAGAPLQACQSEQEEGEEGEEGEEEEEKREEAQQSDDRKEQNGGVVECSLRRESLPKTFPPHEHLFFPKTTTSNLHSKQEPHLPSPITTQMAILADKDLFHKTLAAFHASLGTRLMFPRVGGRNLDLHTLYNEASLRGGFEMVTRERKWKEIALALDFPPTVTNASYLLRKYYIILLHRFEQVYFLGREGHVILPEPSIACSLQASEAEVNTHCLQEVHLARKRRKVLLNSAQALGDAAKATTVPTMAVDPTSSIGASVSGSIDGKFDYGYLVTVMVGTRKLRGVLYHVPQTTTLINSSPLVNNVGGGSELGLGGLARVRGTLWPRRRRKKRISRKDPKAPRQNRTGYNFFFAEQRVKLKQAQPERGRVISRIIGELWNKLSEDERTPYQERGLKDKERYQKEMSEYKENLKLRLPCDTGVGVPNNLQECS